MQVFNTFRLIPLAAGFALAAVAAQLPTVFEPGVRPGEYVARIGTSAVSITSQGVQFDRKSGLRMAHSRAVNGTLEHPLAGVSNYFIGAKTRTAVPHFERLRFHEVYPGVDVVYYGREGKLEYDFIAAPHASLAQIQIAFSTPVALTPEGDLATAAITHRRPRVFQNGRELVSRYHLLNNTATVEIEGRDESLALVIDPVIESATFFGGASYEAAKALKVDAQGNVYIAGQAPNAGPFAQPFPAGNNPAVDVAVFKYSPQTNTLLYFNVIGGDQDDIVNALAIDATGAAYIAGSTRSANFPVANGVQMTIGSTAFPDAFVAKFSPDGKTLSYSTYLGGSGSDEAFAIALDAAGAAYVGGTTGSRNFPLVNAFQSVFGGSILNQSVTGFLAVISPAGNRLSYATLLGGAKQDQIRAVALDSAGNVYTAGNTASADFPIRGGGVQSTLPGLVSGFIAKFTTDLSQLAYSTYVGGRSTTSVNALTVDAQGQAIGGGYTSSTDFPVKQAPQSRYGGGDRDAFVVKLNATGTDYVFATYLGGADIDTINDLTLEANGMLTVAGSTASADFPQRNGLQAFQSKSPNQDAFVTKFLNGSLVFSTLIGGTGDDQAFGVQTDATGATYIAGVTASTDFPVKAGGFQTQFGGGGGDMFFVKLSADASLTSGIPSITVSPAVLNFIAAQGATTALPPNSVSVTNLNGAVSFTVVAAGSTWLTATPARGDAPATVVVTANPSGLPIGVYTGNVRIAPTNGTAAATISVTLTVANPAPLLQSVSPPKVPTGSPDTEFMLSGSGFTANTAIQVAVADGSLAQTLSPNAATDSSLRFTIPKSMMFRDTLIQIRVKDPGSPAASNTIAVQVGDRFPTITGVANAASGSGDAIAPGEYVTISGSSLGPVAALRGAVSDGGVANNLVGGVRVWFDNIAAPLLSLSDHSVVAVAPWSLAGKQTSQVAVEYLGVRSNPMTLAVTPAAPAIFTATGTGIGQGLVFNESGLSNAAFLPAAKGSLISFYFTGAGVMAPGVADGAISTTVGSGPVLSMSVTLDGLPCEVVSVGNAIGEVSGMVQATVRVPGAARSGNVPIQVIVGGVASQAGVVVAIQ